MTRRGPIIAAAALAAVVLAAVAAAANPGVTVLAHRATQLLHSQAVYRKAVLLEAEGTPAKAGHPVKTADKIIKWHFVFDNRKTKDKWKSVSINAVHSLLGKPKGSTQPFLQDQPVDPIPTMTFTRAVQLLNAAGWTQGFIAAKIAKPLYPGVKDVEYIFVMAGGKIVAVDTKTGAVSKIS